MPFEGDPVPVGKEPYPPEKKVPLDAVFTAVRVEEGYGGTTPAGATLLEMLLLFNEDLGLEEGRELGLDHVDGNGAETEA